MAQPSLEEQIKSAKSYAEEMANLATENMDVDIQTPEVGELRSVARGRTNLSSTCPTNR